MERLIFAGESYQIVDEIPPHHVVWNIGANMGTDEYIPLCMVYPNSYAIRIDTLKALKLSIEEVQIIRAAAGCGAMNFLSCKKMCNSKSAYERERARKALPVYQRISHMKG